MMNTRRVVLLFAVALVLLGLMATTPARGKPTDAIIVTGADSVLNLSVTRSTGLENSTSIVGPRFVVQYANSMRNYSLVVSQGLINSTASVVPRFVVQCANSMRDHSLIASQGLIDSTASVAPRIVMQYANSNRAYALSYPAALFGDSTPPQIIGAVTTSGNEANFVVSWTTNEFARSVFFYRTQPGEYPWVITDTLYYKDHSVVLSGLTAGQPYYFKIRSVDLSGNSSDSIEYSFVTKSYVYLPIVKK